MRWNTEFNFALIIGILIGGMVMRVVFLLIVAPDAGNSRCDRLMNTYELEVVRHHVDPQSQFAMAMWAEVETECAD